MIRNVNFITLSIIQAQATIERVTLCRPSWFLQYAN